MSTLPDRSATELRHLRTLIAIEHTGNLSKAADRLCLTQSAVSHQIKSLEAELGATLLYREDGQLCFTPVGQRLLNLAHHILPTVARTELEIKKLQDSNTGPLRIAVECHTCFDWLMPSMDEYRSRWPEVELDIVSGFHSDPVALLHKGQAELAIVSDAGGERYIHYEPLFSFEMVGVVPVDSPLARRRYLKPTDFQQETLITYPVPDDMLDIMKFFLQPAGIKPKRRSSELTIALLQLVASRRGLSALPAWAVKPYVDKGYVAGVKLGRTGLRSTLYAAMNSEVATRLYVSDFIRIMKSTCASTLPDIEVAAA